MYKVLAHELAAQELEDLPGRLRGQMFRLIERLETEGQLKMPHSKAIGGGLFELRVGGTVIARSLYCYVKDQNIYLLHAFIKKTEKTPANAIKLARQRLEDFE
ncbi:type II toxin-antitoxin system RelE/ParE family toxin [Erwinia sp. MMLR14_017]|uniref:type II toxin-antitoxin system RelE/ParE family toxin n=1 Tax=Erwinia sp. MMLR14_017 TaxID=3093842 RepID=UPI00298F9F10|nr:type II toxin-antitoxin system RelE/ParE family toxin [Erwinia sp. MMLR14_017]MDW8845196.1 type II toxin-antitoxin system RelE/ParE family toxin [Erwinia sp. MMLR14_017]